LLSQKYKETVGMVLTTKEEIDRLKNFEVKNAEYKSQLSFAEKEIKSLKIGQKMIEDYDILNRKCEVYKKLLIKNNISF